MLVNVQIPLVGVRVDYFATVEADSINQAEHIVRTAFKLKLDLPNDGITQVVDYHDLELAKEGTIIDLPLNPKHVSNFVLSHENMSQEEIDLGEAYEYFRKSMYSPCVTCHCCIGSHGNNKECPQK